MHGLSRLITQCIVASIALLVAACATGIDQDAAGGGMEGDSDSGSSASSAGDSGSGWHPTDAGHGGDASSSAMDAATTLGDGGTPHDSSVTTFDSAPPPPPSNACGVCDRDWLCNGIDDAWASVGGRCVDQRTGTALRCNGILDGASATNVGTWAGNASSFSMYFDSLGGGTVTIDCTPL